ncbi:hypothetical protein HPB52_013302 [Rhipicephalus sanguineus]|uniref:DDE Tnp4 domain-containing protein n=1 Tax=Rhipicephalus sanguineus TaxID=34632 RepID=A0A9D4TA24_RHISA|nr:hypothetical protein HPB52_013302 [Rhipicephalus sanguineus]
MADHYGCVAYFTDYAGRVEEITQDEAYRYAPPLRQVLRDRHNPIEVYNDAGFLSQSLFQAGGATPLVRLPNASEAAVVMEEFYAMARFPGVSGCIDCTHVPMKNPGGEDAEVFRNRKGYFSINVQAITGPQLQFFDLVASWPGSAHDSRIFDNSSARVQYERGTVPGILLGGKAYPCRSYLMTPFRDTGTKDSPKHSVERAFGVWKRRFPCLDMTLQIKTSSVPIIITACAALHNFGHLLREPVPPPPQSQVIHDSSSPATISSAPPPPAAMPLVPDTADGFRMRERIVAQYFT